MGEANFYYFTCSKLKNWDSSSPRVDHRSSTRSRKGSSCRPKLCLLELLPVWLPLSPSLPSISFDVASPPLPRPSSVTQPSSTPAPSSAFISLIGAQILYPHSAAGR